MGSAAVGFRFVLGTVFVLAGLAKLPRRAEFEAAVRGYRLVPERAVPSIARWLPVVELVAGALLLLGLGTAAVAALLGAFLVVFTGAVAINLARGRAIDCGCYGAGPARTIGWPTLVRNLGLLAMAVFVTAEAPAAFGLDAVLGEALALAEGLGLPREKAFEVLAATPLGAQAERRRESIESGEYPPRFALYLARKDAELVASAAREAGVDLRLTEAARSWLAEAEEDGFGDRDYSAVLARILGSS